MMSPCVTATHTAPAPCSASSAASCRRIAATDRACMAAIDSPPGNTASDGWVCTTDHNGSWASSSRRPPLPLPVVALDDVRLEPQRTAPAGAPR